MWDQNCVHGIDNRGCWSPLTVLSSNNGNGNKCCFLGDCRQQYVFIMKPHTRCAEPRHFPLDTSMHSTQTGKVVSLHIEYPPALIIIAESLIKRIISNTIHSRKILIKHPLTLFKPCLPQHALIIQEITRLTIRNNAIKKGKEICYLTALLFNCCLTLLMPLHRASLPGCWHIDKPW